jgi:hypothetical protein
MNIRTLTNYVNLDVDDSYTVQDISFWFNKGIANYNLLPPLTTYPIVEFGTQGFNENSQYPLDDTFMLGVMLPFVSSSIRSSESSVMEKQLFMQEYMLNSMTYKRSIDIPLEFMRNKKNEDLSVFEIGEGIFLTDFTRAPFAGEWQSPSLFKEIAIEKDEE